MKAAYHERIAIKRGKPRVCSVCQVTRLSRYNTGKVCGSCEAAAKEAKTDFAQRLSVIVS